MIVARNTLKSQSKERAWWLFLLGQRGGLPAKERLRKTNGEEPVTRADKTDGAMAGSVLGR